MWTTISVSRWTFLLCLAAVILFSASEGGEVESKDIGLPCCKKFGSIMRGTIPMKCYEQKPRHDCKLHAFLIINKKNEWMCIHPMNKWLKTMREKGILTCSPLLLKRPFEDLDDDDLE